MPRRRLGVALRRLREQAGVSLDEAARALDCSASKVSRLENGKGVPRSRDVRDLIARYGDAAEPHRERLLGWAIEGQRQPWWSDFKDVTQGDLMADHLQRYVELEADATVIKGFEPDLIHGLLQTEAYAHATCSAFFPLSDEDERARFVEFRMQRQEALRAPENPLALKLCTGVGALLLPIGGEAVMIEQLRHLLALIADERLMLDFRVVPSLAGAPWVLGGPISILSFADDEDQDVVYLEHREGATYLEDQPSVERYEYMHANIQDDALGPAESVTEIERAIQTLERRAAAGSPA